VPEHEVVILKANVLKLTAMVCMTRDAKARCVPISHTTR
jgi:hypothetical protein